MLTWLLMIAELYMLGFRAVFGFFIYHDFYLRHFIFIIKLSAKKIKMVVKALAFFTSVIVAGFMIANLLTAIPEQDKDLIFSTGALVSLEQIKEAFKWT